MGGHGVYKLGDKEVIPGKKVVSQFFKKPVRFTDFSDCVREIEEEYQLSLNEDLVNSVQMDKTILLII